MLLFMQIVNVVENATYPGTVFLLQNEVCMTTTAQMYDDIGIRKLRCRFLE
jgi:hypothetical protein